jgi:hypothetical protein
MTINYNRQPDNFDEDHLAKVAHLQKWAEPTAAERAAALKAAVARGKRIARLQIQISALKIRQQQLTEELNALQQPEASDRPDTHGWPG